MSAAIERFFTQFDLLTNRVIDSRQQDFSRNLRSWLACIDSAPAPIGTETARLSALQSWEEIERDVIQPPGSMVGSGQLNWPDREDLRLAGQLVLFRRLASGELDAMDFSFDYYFSGDNNITRTIQDMADRLFRPLSEDLRLRFGHILDSNELVEDDRVPAANRFVRLNHNSLAYLEAMEKITSLEEALRASNAIEPEEKATLQAEIQSGKVLLSAPRTRVGAVKAVLVSPLTWIAAAFASGALGELAGIALHAIAALLGIPL